MEELINPFLPKDDMCLLPNYQMQTALQTDPHLRQAMANGDFLAILKYAENKTVIAEYVADAIFAFRAMLDFAPSLIVYNFCSVFLGERFARELSLPSFLITMQMSIKISAYEGPPGLLPPKMVARMPGCLVKLAWYFCFWLFGSLKLIKILDNELDKEVGKWPKKHEGGSKRYFRDVAMLLGKNPGCTHLIARSKISSPPPADYSAGDKSAMVGAFVLSAEHQVRAWPPSRELMKFLEEPGGAPVYIGWGSMIAVSPQHMIELAVRALSRVGRRGIILSGWANLAVDLLSTSNADDADELVSYAERFVFVLDKSAPHEWLFPQCIAIVHHGGAGTTASALRSGRPCVITPCFADQPEIADKVEALGVGVALKQFHRVTADDLVAGIEHALNDDCMVAKAKSVGAQMRAEDGATEAAARIMACAGEAINAGEGSKDLMAGDDLRVETPELEKRGRPLLAAQAA